MDTKQPIVPSAGFSLQAMHAVPPSRNPAFVYIASLAAGSRRTMRDALQTIVDVLLGYAPGNADANPNRAVSPDGENAPIVSWDAFPWHELDYQHTAAVRAALVSHYNVPWSKCCQPCAACLKSAGGSVISPSSSTSALSIWARCRQYGAAGTDRSACRAGEKCGAAQAMRRWIARRCA